MLERFKTQHITIGSEHFELEVFRSPDEEFTAHFESEADVEQKKPEPPLYGNIWPAAEALAQYLAKKNLPSASQTVLEIGCGLALPSLLCARKGAQVEAMDHQAEAAELLLRNTRRNALAPIEFHLASFQEQTRKLGSFDLLLASDILYEPSLYEAIETFLILQLRAGGTILIADPGRYAAEHFGRKLKSLGSYQCDKQLLSHSQKPLDIHVFQLHSR